MRLALFFIGIGLVSLTASAQPEIVPAEHSVYRFLHAQRVAGRLPLYQHETRPLDRATLQRHLNTLSTHASRLDYSARYWLREFRRELYEPAGSREQLIGGPEGFTLPLETDTEKFLYYYHDADWRVAVHAHGAVQARISKDDETYRGVAFVPEGIVEGHYRDWLGFYSGTFNGQQLAGDTRVLQADPSLAPLYYISRQAIPPGSFDRSTASLRIARASFSAEIANERLLVGPSFNQPLLLSENTDYFPFVRLALDTRVVRYQFVHAALGDRSTNPFDSVDVLLAPERYMAMHRLTLQPVQRLSLSFTEVVIYGLRGPELAYLNPFYPIKPAEHALWDRDNTLFALDAVYRPIDGVEAHGTYLVDDLDFSLLGENSYNNKWAVQGGVGVSLERFLPGTFAFAEYTRIEPFTYTHRFRLDESFYNSYQHNGRALGHPLGPNSDEWSGGVDVWLPFRARARTTLRYRRRAENFVNGNGELVNVGGDVRDGTQPPFRERSKVFLRGDRFEGLGASLGIEVEPIRGIALGLFGDAQRWDRDPDQLFMRAELEVAF